MNLYLLRHGIAAPRKDSGNESDADRPLTAQGMKRMRKAAKGVRRLGISFDKILTSPLIRARQTAEIVAAALDLQDRVEDVAVLAPDSSIQDLFSALADHGGKEHLLLVGHEPFLGSIASRLLTHDPKRSITVVFKKGGLCRIEVDRLPPNAPGTLHWLLTPKQLRAIGASA
jgi:phosphohistidine phosphatase